jgi:TfoX/Sxy family transcriptional regulator of competence genes
VSLKKAARKTATGARRAAAKLRPKRTDDLLEVEPAFAPVVDFFARDPEVTAGKMMASFGLKVGGKIFAMMVRGELVAKLPKERVSELVREKQGAFFDPRRDGRVMKEWVAVGDRKLPWLALAQEAYRFVKAGRK